MALGRLIVVFLGMIEVSTYPVFVLGCYSLGPFHPPEHGRRINTNLGGYYV